MINDQLETTFLCIHCHHKIPLTTIGTAHRNHCPFCLWSKHVDERTPGDRKSTCHSPMEPIGLTFKHEGVDKYGKVKQGEVMIVHRCTECGKVNINRIAGDDNGEAIISLLTQKSLTKKIKEALHQNDIDILMDKDEPEIRKQLFGETLVS